MANPTQTLGAQALFAANVRRIRRHAGLTQEQVAEAAGLHHNYVSSVERGERNISIGNMERFAIALGVPLALLVSEPDAD
jgi:transcriptional regulator with XRE-family HTH domain